MKMLLVTGVLSLLFGGSMVVLFAHALSYQQVVMQEGY